MAKSPSNFSGLSETLAKHNLICFGGLEITQNECASGFEALIGHNALLVGNAGSDMWEVFSQSGEYQDGRSDPMNRWTKRVLDGVAESLGSRVVYPFDEPYWPFQKLAQNAAGVRPSPLGILIHPKFGLWYAFRGLLIFDEDHHFSSHIKALIAHPKNLIHPCDTCQDKPCLSACPVGAFTGDYLDVKSCFAHLDADIEPVCLSDGCRARCACPIATEHQYDSAQIKFHMQSYRGA